MMKGWEQPFTLLRSIVKSPTESHGAWLGHIDPVLQGHSQFARRNVADLQAVSVSKNLHGTAGEFVG